MLASVGECYTIRRVGVFPKGQMPPWGFAAGNVHIPAARVTDGP